MNSSQKISSTLLAVAALAVSSQTFAARSIDAQRDDRPSTSVSVADLDLNVPGDVQVAHQRVKAAAMHMCRDASRDLRWSRLASWNWRTTCVRTAIADASSLIQERQFAAALERVTQRIAALR
jgi:UrcA family protein